MRAGSYSSGNNNDDNNTGSSASTNITADINVERYTFIKGKYQEIIELFDSSKSDFSLKTIDKLEDQIQDLTHKSFQLKHLEYLTILFCRKLQLIYLISFLRKETLLLSFFDFQTNLRTHLRSLYNIRFAYSVYSFDTFNIVSEGGRILRVWGRRNKHQWQLLRTLRWLRVQVRRRLSSSPSSPLNSTHIYKFLFTALFIYHRDLAFGACTSCGQRMDYLNIRYCSFFWKGV